MQKSFRKTLQNVNVFVEVFTSDIHIKIKSVIKGLEMFHGTWKDRFWQKFLGKHVQSCYIFMTRRIVLSDFYVCRKLTNKSGAAMFVFCTCSQNLPVCDRACSFCSHVCSLLPRSFSSLHPWPRGICWRSRRWRLAEDWGSPWDTWTWAVFWLWDPVSCSQTCNLFGILKHNTIITIRNVYL